MAQQPEGCLFSVKHWMEIFDLTWPTNWKSILKTKAGAKNMQSHWYAIFLHVQEKLCASWAVAFWVGIIGSYRFGKEHVHVIKFHPSPPLPVFLVDKHKWQMKDWRMYVRIFLLAEITDTLQSWMFYNVCSNQFSPWCELTPLHRQEQDCTTTRKTVSPLSIRALRITL